MKISAQEENGLRIMLRLCRTAGPAGMTINEISLSEKLSVHYVAKMLRVLRIGGFVKSNRGKSGGYYLAHDSKEIKIIDLMETLGGKFFNDECSSMEGYGELCTDSVDCSLNSLFTVIHYSLHSILGDITLADLCAPEGNFKNQIESNSVLNRVS